MNVTRHLGKLRNLQLNAFIKLPVEGVGLPLSKISERVNGNFNFLVFLKIGN